ncbi:unnamed protein product [Staurois parvus]|uniref:Uncharacterized protein n=1 Tax=Staurois parvus TaxID=386267 RepID=A0ABN9GDL9_9NEOB|nr:unnamed protein product [Staurois parvus]
MTRDCGHTTEDDQSLWTYRFLFSPSTYSTPRGGLTIRKLGHCPRARGQ